MTTPSKPYLQVDWDRIKLSGLLSPERIAYLEAECVVRIHPLTHNGRNVPNARVIDYPAGPAMVIAEGQGSYSLLAHHTLGLIAELVTPEELKMLNDHACSAHADRIDAERFAKARKVPDTEWADGVFLGDQYYASLDEAFDALVCDWSEGESEVPAFLWAAKPEVVVDGLSVADIVEDQICDRGWEDMDVGDLNGVEALQVALDAFVEANAAVVAYPTDYSTAIIVTPETRAQINKDIAPSRGLGQRPI